MKELNKQNENDNEKQPIPSLDDSDTDLLFCQQERLDQNSPELWPETMPGINEFTPSSLFSSPPKPVLDVVSLFECFFYIVSTMRSDVLRYISYSMPKEVSSLQINTPRLCYLVGLSIYIKWFKYRNYWIFLAHVFP